jgi:hypothetical protein
MKLQSKFLKLYHSFTISDEWEGSLQADAEKIADEFSIGFAEWLDTLKPNQRVSFWSKNGEGKGVFNMDNEQLLEIYKKEKGL